MRPPRSLGALRCAAAEGIIAAPEETLFSVGPVFPLRIEHPDPTFESIRCEGCGESVLTTYVREVDGRHLCVACEERRVKFTR